MVIWVSSIEEKILRSLCRFGSYPFLSWIDITGGSLRCLDTWLCNRVCLSVCPSVCLSVRLSLSCRNCHIDTSIWANNGEIRKANLAFTFSFYDSFTVTMWWVLVLVVVLVVVVVVVVQKSQKPLAGTSKKAKSH